MLILLPLLLGYTLEADRMVILLKPAGTELELEGSVHVVSRGFDITAGRGTHVEATRYSVLTDSVLVRGPDYTVTGDTLHHRPSPEYLLLVGNAKLEDVHRTISADRIEVVNDSAFATGSVVVYIKAKRATVAGDSGVYDLEAKSGKMMKTPTALVARKDTMNLLAELFLMAKDTLWAVGGVALSSGQTRAWGDTLRFVSKADFAPGAISPDTQAADTALAESLTVDTLAGDTQAAEPEVEYALITGGARVVWASGEGSSDSLFITIVDGKMREVLFIDSAVVRHSTGDGEVSLEAAMVQGFIAPDGELERVECLRLKEGVYTPKEKEIGEPAG